MSLGKSPWLTPANAPWSEFSSRKTNEIMNMLRSISLKLKLILLLGGALLLAAARRGGRPDQPVLESPVS